MSSSGAIKIGCFSESGPGWPWIRDAAQFRRELQWRFFSTKRTSALEKLVRRPHMGRLRAARQLRHEATGPGLDLVVTHGPNCSTWAAMALAKTSVPHHLAFAFSYSNLPTGWRRKLATLAYRSVDRFVCFSSVECDVYANYFAIPREKIQAIRWSVRSPRPMVGPRTISHDYFVAMGGEGRDYRTLSEAARMMPRTSFVFIARPQNLEGLDLPLNVQVLFNIPPKDAWSIVHYARAAIIPLNDSMTPCGHGTLVGGMHLGKAHVTTDSTALIDYVQHERTALLVPPKDPDAIRLALERLLDDDSLVKSLGTEAQRFAEEHCSEKSTVRYFHTLLDEIFA